MCHFVYYIYRILVYTHWQLHESANIVNYYYMPNIIWLQFDVMCHLNNQKQVHQDEIVKLNPRTAAAQPSQQLNPI